MSFSKAKIQRFNDLKECTPSPANYNVQQKDKVKCGVISKAGKLLKKSDSPPGSETGSVHSSPCFQTPTIPKKKKLLSFKIGKNNDREELREKIVECNNKDLYIRDLTEQIEEMNGKINNLELEKKQLAALQEHRTKECTGINVKVKGLNQELCHMKKLCDDFKNQNSTEIKEILECVGKYQCFFNAERSQEISSLNEELQDVKNKLEEREAKVKLLEENFKEVQVLTEMQTKERIQELETIWKSKLEDKEKESEAILKECQAISEYNIIQSEIEKNRFKSQYEEMATKCDELEKELSNLRSEKHAYELSITTFRDTIEVLKKRLINSDGDVEQLKEEIGKCEERILYYETKCSEMAAQLKETQIANEELEMQYESTSKIMQDQVKNTEKKLLAKVDALKQKQTSEDKQLLQQTIELNHNQHVLIKQSEEIIIKSQAWIEELHLKQIELENRLAEEIEESAQIRKKYIENSGKYDKLAHQFEQLLQELDEAKSRVQELEKVMELLENEKQELSVKYAEVLGHQNHKQKIKYLRDLNMKTSELIEKKIDLESKNNKLNKMVEKLKKEVEDLKKAGKKVQELEKVMERLENEKQELSVKYAEVLGHQNHKQKIKHLRDLNMMTSELTEKKIDLESENNKLNKMVEKLKKEVEDLKKTGKKGKGKENVDSPKCVKGIHSPGPLKDKNSQTLQDF